MLHRSYITELLLTRFSPRPRLLFAVIHKRQFSFFSLPQSEKLSPLVTANFHMKFSKGISDYDCSFASGLIYFHNMCIPKEDEDPKSVICNPITGHYVILPELRKVNMESSYLGFDPIENKFKVLFTKTSSHLAYKEADHRILTLGIGKMSWRKIQCPFTHSAYDESICINGVLYYKALQFEGKPYNPSYGIVCFDVRSEKFKFIDAESVNDSLTKLINYKGKLCWTNLMSHDDRGERRLELHMWVLEHVEKQEWSKFVYTLWDKNDVNIYKVNVVGMMTTTGEIVLPNINIFEPFYVFFFNPEKKTLRRVEIQGSGANCEAFENYRTVYTFVDDCVEDLSVNDSKKLKPSLVKQDINIKRNTLQCFGASREVIGDDYVEDLSVNDSKQVMSTPTKENLNIITKRPKPKQRQHTSYDDVYKSAPYLKNEEKNKYASVPDMLFNSAGLAILFFALFIFFFIIFSSIILLV